MSLAVGTLPPKAKTKAKARYLKRKKERKKHRKVATSPKKVPSHPKNGTDDEDQSDQDEEELEVVSTPKPSEQKKPPRKRQKVDSDEELSESSSDSEQSEAEEEEEHSKKPQPAQHNSPTPPPPALPVFPLPVAPDAPSKATLALQGLDQALLNAELVEATTTVPLDEIDNCAGRSIEKGEQPILSTRMNKRLRELGIVELFAVQTALLPFLLPAERRARALYLPYNPPRDVCASAPTGSGKTLGYVVPIVEILSSRISTRLRALIVLPTRDLVLQVQETFEAVAKGRGLKIGVATGQHSFAHEQAQLIDDQSRTLQGGSSKVDILICTPGRLIDHLSGTQNFSLQHLRFLVIDEADRLLAQSFQDWLAHVLAALRPSHPTSSSPQNQTAPERLSTSFDTESLANGVASISFSAKSSSEMSIPFHDAVAPFFLSTLSPSSETSINFQTDIDDQKHSSCQKLLFSATLTRDPARIAALGLRDPKYFIVQGKDSNATPTTTEHSSIRGKEWAVNEGFAMPAGLSEHYLTISTARKPLALFYLVHSRGVTNALVFTKSAESTSRLVKLFSFFEESLFTSASSNAMDVDGERDRPARKRIVAQEYSSELPAGERKSILEKFKNREIDILVCSDLISRGIDIAQVPHVVSYDAPVDMRKYVHRVGRTARAGHSGDAWTLVEDQEARFFKAMMREAVHLDKVRKEKLGESETADLEVHYKVALERLKEVYSRSH